MEHVNERWAECSTECSICLEEVDETPPRSGTCNPCAHRFHGECLLKHVLQNKQANMSSNCPVCRAPMDGYTAFPPPPRTVDWYEDTQQNSCDADSYLSVIWLPRHEDDGDGHVLFIRTDAVRSRTPTAHFERVQPATQSMEQQHPPPSRSPCVRSSNAIMDSNTESNAGVETTWLYTI